MKIWRSIDEVSGHLSASAVTIGNFDGVHLGHQEIVRALGKIAAPENLQTVAITFDPHPAVVLGGHDLPKLMTVEERVEMLGSLGVNHVIVQPFMKDFAEIDAEQFVLELLIQKLKLRALCIGTTTHVGRRREGTPKKLSEFAAEFDFALTLVKDIRVGTEIVSSSRVRTLLQLGDVRGAAEMLGRPFQTTGIVETGDGRGRLIGFPTANLGGVQTLLPSSGVYAVLAEIGGVSWKGVTNIGFNPTFRLHSPLTVETHILEFSGELPGKPMKVHWIERIRGERRFASVEALKLQIEEDIKSARKTLASQ